MGYTKSDLMEQNLELLKISVNRVCLCEGDPQTYAEVQTNAIGCATINQYDFTGPVDGNVDGRKIILSGITITASSGGTASHLAFVNTATTTLWLSFPRNLSRDVSPGETVSVSDIEIEEGDFSTTV